MAKTTSGPAKKTGGSKPAKGRIITPPNASKELPKSFYQQDKAKRNPKFRTSKEHNASTVSGFPLAVFLYPKRGETICSLTDSSMNSSV